MSKQMFSNIQSNAKLRIMKSFTETLVIFMSLHATELTLVLQDRHLKRYIHFISTFKISTKFEFIWEVAEL